MTASVHHINQTRRETFDPNERFISKSQLASHFGFSPRWVNYQLSEGLPHYRVGRSVRFQLSSATAWLVNKGEQ
jgi:hypothetical protein